MCEKCDKRAQMREALRMLSSMVDICTNDMEDVRYALILVRPGPDGVGVDTMMECNLSVDNAASIFQQAADRLRNGQAHVQPVEGENPWTH